MKQPSQPPAMRIELEFLSDPAMIVDLEGHVRQANSAARGLFGALSDGPCLFALVKEERGLLMDFLRRASRSTSPYLGVLTPVQDAAEERFQTMAARIGEDGGPLLILRLQSARDDRFSVLNRRLQEIDQQLNQRLREKALLEEALTENRVLVRELQHRVKNNIQQMLGLISMSAAGQSSPEVAAVMGKAADRLRAMSMAQEAIYLSDGAGTVSARTVIEAVGRTTASSFGATAALRLSLAEASVVPEEAHCLALICNELVTNACKHGLVDAARTVELSLTPHTDGLSLSVRDDGPGFNEEASSRSSGLTLVRLLCRQIGANMSIENENGLKVVVQFQPSGVS